MPVFGVEVLKQGRSNQTTISRGEEVITMRNINRLTIMSLVAVIALAGLAAPAAKAATVLQADMVRVAGEEPSATLLFPASAKARLDDQGRVKVDMGLLDPARYPVGCNAQVRAGSLQAAVPLVLLPAADPLNEAGVDGTIVAI